MGQYDDRLSVALTGDFNDLKALEEPFARSAGLDPAVMEARKAETRAKYDRTVKEPDDLRKSYAPEPLVGEAAVLKSIEAIERLAAIRKKVRTGKKRT